MSKIERQLILYDILTRCQVAEYADITGRLPIQKRMLQRDICDLDDAGLVRVVYSKKDGGYVKMGEAAFREETEGKRRKYLLRLNRLGRLMKELYNEDIPLTEEKDHDDIYGERMKWTTAKEAYQKLFPEVSERTRQRDFQTLCHIGYMVRYDNWEHCFRLDFPEGLAEDFGIYREGRKLIRRI